MKVSELKSQFGKFKSDLLGNYVPWQLHSVLNLSTWAQNYYNYYLGFSHLWNELEKLIASLPETEDELTLSQILKLGEIVYCPLKESENFFHYERFCYNKLAVHLLPNTYRPERMYAYLKGLNELDIATPDNHRLLQEAEIPFNVYSVLTFCKIHNTSPTPAMLSLAKQAERQLPEIGFLLDKKIPQARIVQCFNEWDWPGSQLIPTMLKLHAHGFLTDDITDFKDMMEGLRPINASDYQALNEEIAFQNSLDIMDYDPTRTYALRIQFDKREADYEKSIKIMERLYQEKLPAKWFKTLKASKNIEADIELAKAQLAPKAVSSYPRFLATMNAIPVVEPELVAASEVRLRM